MDSSSYFPTSTGGIELTHSSTASSPSGRKLRINLNKSVIIGRFPFNFELSQLIPPISVLKDEIVTKHEDESHRTPKAVEAAAFTVPWRLRDSSGDDKTEYRKHFLGSPDLLCSDSYFLLIESRDGYTEVLPVSAFHRFMPDVTFRSVSPLSSEAAENEARQKVVREADLSARVLSLKKHESDDEPMSKEKLDHSQEKDSQDDEYGIKRQELKRQKKVIKSKLVHGGKSDDYVSSALAVTTLRQSTVTWDYDEGHCSDDEEDLFAEEQQLIDDDIGEDDTKGDDDFEAGQDTLTGYGKRVKSLLKQQENQEVDDELDQYSDDDEEMEVSNNVENSDSIVPRDVKSPISSVTPRPSPSRAVQVTTSAQPLQTKSPTKEEVEAKVIRVLMQNMGRMNVKLFMGFLKFKEKNEEFRMIQAAISRMCTIQSEEHAGQKLKFISLKPEFRR
ncbi:hypothetical protein IE077_001268 [Cardiosporidium cionae]|uniref:Transcription initiation factor IIF subunit alpha n=1 Tax=Cardiosporidium cionae TaxID=476202 RepID=A0ABQ7JDA7_9APIC|nr:hypothetical protein IE077_001268 [Cardiosporidium cionae]|eukprot:KAF8821983.1 hypothetical protein IE077_001268 [Cardiosporidium cionae]